MGAPARRRRALLARPLRSLAGIRHRRQVLPKTQNRGVVGVRPVASPPDRGRTSHLPGPRAGDRRRADHRGRRAADHAHLGGGRGRGAARDHRLRRRAQRRRRGALAGAAGRACWAPGSRPRSAATSPPAPPVASAADPGTSGAQAPAGVTAIVVARRRGGRRAQPRRSARLPGRHCWPSPGSGSPAAAARSASTRACGCSVSGQRMAKKLVLVVVDAMHPAMFRRAIEEDRAPTFAALAGAGPAGRGLRLQLPLGDPGRLLGDDDRARARRPLGDGDELVPPGRAPLHRVRLLLRGDPDLRPVPGDVRPRLQHEPRPPELGGADRVRAPRRRRGPHRHHPVPDLPRPAPAQAQPRGAGPQGRRRRQLPARRLGSRRVLLRRSLRQPLDRLWAQPSPGPEPATSTRPASPRSWSTRAPTTSSSSAFPTTTSTRTATGPTPRSTRSPRRI